jgi:uncharacterized protein HemY
MIAASAAFELGDFARSDECLQEATTRVEEFRGIDGLDK